MNIIRNIVRWFGILLLVGASVWFYFTPQLAFREIRVAVRENDLSLLESRVDFPALRTSLKATVQRRLADKFGQGDNPLGRFGMALAGPVLESLVNQLITPETLAFLLRGDRSRSAGSPPRGDTSVPDTVPKDPGQSQPENAKAESEPPLEKVKIYETFNRFAISVRKSNDPREPITFVLTRAGLLDWKLSEIRNPF